MASGSANWMTCLKLTQVVTINELELSCILWFDEKNQHSRHHARIFMWKHFNGVKTAYSYLKTFSTFGGKERLIGINVALSPSPSNFPICQHWHFRGLTHFSTILFLFSFHGPPFNKCQYKPSRQMRPETHIQWIGLVQCGTTRQQTHAWLISLVFKNNTLFFPSSSA